MLTQLKKTSWGAKGTKANVNQRKPTSNHKSERQPTDFCENGVSGGGVGEGDRSRSHSLMTPSRGVGGFSKSHGLSHYQKPVGEQKDENGRQPTKTDENGRKPTSADKNQRIFVKMGSPGEG